MIFEGARQCHCQSRRPPKRTEIPLESSVRCFAVFVRDSYKGETGLALNQEKESKKKKKNKLLKFRGDTTCRRHDDECCIPCMRQLAQSNFCSFVFFSFLPASCTPLRYYPSRSSLFRMLCLLQANYSPSLRKLCWKAAC